MPQSIRVGTATAHPGEMAWGEIPVPDRVARQLRPPLVAVVNGTASGPMVYVGAGAHGDEFNAMEAVRRAVLRLRPEAVRGTVVFVPLQNRAAFEARARRTPSDDKNIEECFPGDPAGTPTEVLAHLLFEHAVTRAQYALDLHTATRGGWNLVHALCGPGSPDTAARSRELARTFGARVIVNLEGDARTLGERSGSRLGHYLSVQASAHQIPAATIEFGEGGRLEQDQVQLGLGGIRRVLASLGVCDAPAGEPSPPMREPFQARESVAVRCTTAGFLEVLVRPDDRVRAGQVVARVIGFPDATEDVRAPLDGVVVRLTTEGVVAPRDRVVVVAVP